MDSRERHLSTLGLGLDASVEDVKRAYRELTKRWHPDRFANEPSRHAEATEELRRIVEAYRALTRRPRASTPGHAVIVPPRPHVPGTRVRRRAEETRAAFVRPSAAPPPRKRVPAPAPSPRRLLAARLTARAGVLFALALGLLVLLRLPRPAGLGALSVLLALAGGALGAWLVADHGGVRRLLGVGRADGALTAALALLLFGGLAVLGRVAPFAFVAAEQAYPVYSWGGVGGGAVDGEEPEADERGGPPARQDGERGGSAGGGPARASATAPVAGGTKPVVAGTKAAARTAPPVARTAPVVVRTAPAVAGPAVSRPAPVDPRPGGGQSAPPAPVAVRADAAGRPAAPAAPAGAEPALAARPEPAVAAAPAAAVPTSVLADPAARVAERAAPAPPAPARVAKAGAAPVSAAPTRGPVLLNSRDVGLALDAAYPAALRQAGIGGTVLVRALVEADGSVRQVVVRHSSGRPELDEAARKVARAMWFAPALQGQQATRVWIQFPVAFAAK